MAVSAGRLRPLPVSLCSLFGSRGASNGRRDFYQRINEQHLAEELKNLSMGAHGPPSQHQPFDPTALARRPLRGPEAWQQGSQGFKGSADIAKSRPTRKPWLEYESLRGTSYPTGEGQKGPRWRDLTHGEAQRMQEMYMRKRMLERKILWMKSQHLPNPQRDAKMELRKRENFEATKAALGGDMYPLPFTDTTAVEKKVQSMEDYARHHDLESLFRQRIRDQKLENAKIVKANQPKVGGIIVDPIERHIQRRLLRQRVKIHAGIEAAMTNGSAQISCEFLQGAAISIKRVWARRPRATQRLYYDLLTDHDPAWVQSRLDILAPKIRSILAIKVNMGMTPNIRFVPNAGQEETKSRNLWPHARQVRKEVDAGHIARGFATSDSPLHRGRKST
mmetsp:Transcript_63038/g.136915  ORF Transcript_63038/g.136915 Transcript_63038/m.136915 type:complete len:391 (-) Transcript_63038:28-1200(-)